MTQITRFADVHAAVPAERRKDLFSVLEQRVDALAERHRESMALLHDLRRQVAERDREIADLARRIGQLQRLRDEVAGRVDQMIERLDRMSEWAAAAAEAADEAEAETDGAARA